MPSLKAPKILPQNLDKISSGNFFKVMLEFLYIQIYKDICAAHDQPEPRFDNRLKLLNFPALYYRDLDTFTYKRLLQLAFKHPLDLASKYAVTLSPEAADHVSFFTPV